MDRLNYHHLLYFWVVAKEGSIAAASKRLRLAHPTISGQLRLLEESIGEELFARSGRGLVLTEAGRVAYRYADEIFSLGSELLDTLKRGGGETGRPQRLVVGVADALPPSLVRLFLGPAFELEQIRVVCRAGKSVPEFVTELALHALDVVLADAPANTSPVRAFSHPLGACGTTFFAAGKLAGRARAKFPRSLDGLPFLLPGASSSVRRALEQWFDAQGIRPRIVAELDDSALAKDLGRHGLGVFAAPDVIEAEVMRDYGVKVVGRAKVLRQQFYAISVERKIKHPAVAAICDAARQKIFAAS